MVLDTSFYWTNEKRKLKKCKKDEPETAKERPKQQHKKAWK
jgi:hypothetical protein